MSRIPTRLEPGDWIVDRRAWAPVLRWCAVFALLGAAAIHTGQIRVHMDEWVPAGVAFIAMAGLQGLLALGLATTFTPWLGLATVEVSLAAIALWALSRTVGLPIGPGALVPEPVGRPDVIATSLEAATILAIVPLLARSAGRVSPPRRRSGFLAVGALALVAAGLTWFGLQPTGGTCDPHASSSQSLTGPLVAIDGHSILRRDTPVVRVGPGESFGLVVGLLRNCEGEPLTLEAGRVIATAGDAATWGSLWVMPPGVARPGVAISMRELQAIGRRLPGRVRVAPASSGLPVLVLEVQALGRGQFEGRFWVNGVELSYEARGGSYRSVYASAAGVQVRSRSRTVALLTTG